MDYEGNEYTASKLIKEKREREPNWTEPEKQLLLSLIRIHRNVLDNKCNDSMAIHLKSEVWNEIASNMMAAGYNRSKERLKQQFGRMRAAEAKKLKGALTKFGQNNKNADIKINLNTILDDKDLKPINLMKINETVMHETEKGSSVVLEENIKIKLDKSLTNDKLNINEGNYNENCLSTIPNATELLEYPTNHPYINPKISGNVLENINLISKINTSTQDPPASKSPITTFKTNYNSFDNMDLSNHRSSAKKNCQLQLYRIAAERERIRALKLQHKHERTIEREHLRMLRIQQKRNYVLYRKSVQIQDLKVQLLQDLLKVTKCEINNSLR